MNRTRLTLVALAAAGALALGGCSSGGGDDAGGEATATPEPAPTFAEGSTMAALAEAGTITIGTKFDQPLFGLNGPNGPEGFDVEIGKIIASELGIAEDDIVWKKAVSANREPFIQNGEGRHRHRDLHDQRQAQGSRLVRGTVLPRRAVDPRARGQRRHQGRRTTWSASRSAR
jgi:hypothetical protein